MRPAARVAEAIAILEAIDAGKRPADIVFQAHVRSRRYIGSKDRRALGDFVFGTIRHHARVCWHLERVGLPISARSRLAGYLALNIGTDLQTYFAVDDPHGPPALSDDEYDRLDRLAQSALEPTEMPAEIRLECPQWAEKDLRDCLGQQFEDTLDALRGKAAVDLRVRRTNGCREKALARLIADGFDAAPTPYSPDGIRLKGVVSLAAHPLVRDGLIDIQDEGSQIISLACDVRSGMQVIDFCAGAGGKTIALADILNGAGRVVACDVDRARLDRGRKRFSSTGLNNIEPRLLRNERDAWVSRQKGKFDRVLIDAPCSGAGAWRRNPWARWSQPDLAEVTETQFRIIGSAARLVKPRGWLIYATCSLLACENQQVVDRFLTANPEFRPISAPDWPLVGDLKPVGGSLLLTPAQHGTDGFFISILQREAT